MLSARFVIFVYLEEMRRLAVLLALGLLSACSSSEDGSGSGGSAGTSGAGGAAGSAGSGGISGAAGASGSGGSAGSDAGTPRPYRLGLTTFPYDTTQAAVDYVYAKVAEDADLFTVHTTEGVPWVEALEQKPVEQMGSSIVAKWTKMKAAVTPSQKLYLALTPLDDGRAKLADYWGSAEHMPLPGSWATASFDSADVKSAYLQTCRAAIDFFHPDYLAIGIEVNLLRKNNPAAWSAYVDLHKATYTALKAENPALPIFVTMTGVDLLDGWTDADHGEQMAALADVLPYSDYLGISFYPFMSKYLTDPYPASTWSDLASLAGGKPLVIGESGYPAQAFSIPSYSLSFDGTEAKQNAFVSDMLAAAESQPMPFVVNFLVRDYDALWATLPPGPVQDNGSVWRDTGLYDENGSERSALATWKSALARAAK